MHLKTLTLRGFKSFASTTTLRLEPGITCVVGPNGSGKSNVVDALAWVMGEQGAKTLRGAQMADVIFAGTSQRPALGRAQVDLTIDNADGALPIDYSEVTITRTLFRGGASEYSINDTPARLLDIQELLSDTGMGRQMHVIVGQGQLDAILSSTPEERRGFIEEAAGVLKHRRRKERALRKLADMDQNLVRVLDLTNEIHRQLGPLARQAATARRASLIQARVRDAKARLLADDLVDLRARTEAQAASDEARRARTEELARRVAEARTRLAALEEDERATTPRLERATSAWSELTTLHERLRATVQLADERVSRLSRPLPAPGEDDPEDLDRLAEEATARDAEGRERLEVARRALEEATRARELAEEDDEAAARELGRANRVVADHREKVARLTGDVASGRSRLEAARSEADRARALVEAAEQRQREAESHAADVAREVGPLGERDAAAGAVHAHQEAVERRDASRTRVDALLTQEREARADRARWESRRDTLAENMGPEDATAGLAGAPGVLGDVASLLRVEEGWEDAVAALVAPFADAALVDGLGSAVDQIRRARADGAGRIRMVVAGDAQEDTCPSADVALPDGARWAEEVVSAPGGTPQALGAMLRGAVLCQDLDQLAQVLDLPGVRCAVTVRGDLARGLTVVGSGTATSSVLALHAQYDQAVAGADRAMRREEETARALVEANAALDLHIREANEALRTLREEDAERARAAEAGARASSAASAAQAETGRARAGLARAEEQVAWATEQVAEAQERLTGAQGMAPAEDPATAQARATAAQGAARSAREAETGARLTLRTEEERSRQAQGRARSLRQTAQRVREQRDRHARAEAQRIDRLHRVREVAAAAGIVLASAAQALGRAETERREAEETRLRSSRATLEVRRTIDELTQELAEVTGEGHRDEVARAETALRLEQLQTKVLEELGLEEEQLVAEFGPHNLVPVQRGDPGEEEPQMLPFVREEQERALTRALRDLERLGRVNPLALEEHEALSKRHEFLVAQVRDLKKSKADLLTIITDVDTLVEQAFTQAFADTRAQFAHTFEVLFPGGEGRLVLTDEEDMSRTGVEIEARPAGKKVKRLSLLSGGERSLAALAFLIAIFKARPSPFYVMDEVEAALDDINLSRLLAIFQELQETSQLIVITHQKRTMEIADALYGVTMRDGVTRVVSQRLAS